MINGDKLKPSLASKTKNMMKLVLKRYLSKSVMVPNFCY